MACYSPHIVGVGDPKPNGKQNLIWRGNLAGMVKTPIPCAKCIGCRLEYARGMAARCMMEAACHSENSFVTLTFDDKKLPDGFDGNLSVVDHQLFMKRLRKHYGANIRFYMCGEYGGEHGRPHYHYLLFGVGFPDKVFLMDRKGKYLYRSPTLERLWPFGYSSIGTVDFQSASYVARYCLKKVEAKTERVKFEGDKTVYQVDKASGELKVAEFTQMSRGGRSGRGVGFPWFEKFGSDLFPSDQMVIDGKVNKPPRYFMNQLEKFDPQMYDGVKAVRAENLPHWEESSGVRLRVKEEVKLAQIALLKRSI